MQLFHPTTSVRSFSAYSVVITLAPLSRHPPDHGDCSFFCPVCGGIPPLPFFPLFQVRMAGVAGSVTPTRHRGGAVLGAFPFVYCAV